MNPCQAEQENREEFFEHPASLDNIKIEPKYEDMDRQEVGTPNKEFMDTKDGLVFAIGPFKTEEVYIKSEYDHDLEDYVEEGSNEIGAAEDDQKQLVSGKEYGFQTEYQHFLGYNQNFSCRECDYQTGNEEHFKAHLLWHQDPSRSDKFKCNKCDYQTIYRRRLKVHHLRHKDPSEIEMFRCEVCDFQTKRKGNLKKHQLLHKDPIEDELFNCSDCAYQTIYKSCLTRHQVKMHKSKKFDNCCYMSFKYITPERNT